jgi:hypothetical protein
MVWFADSRELLIADVRLQIEATLQPGKNRPSDLDSDGFTSRSGFRYSATLYELPEGVAQ